jgi:hypothetical protein
VWPATPRGPDQATVIIIGLPYLPDTSLEELDAIQRIAGSGTMEES